MSKPKVGYQADNRILLSIKYQLIVLHTAYRHIIILLLCCISGISSAQYSGLDLLAGEEKKVVNFEYVNGFVIVKVIYGGILYMDFLLDTGASHNILFKKRANDLLGISYTDTILIGGADLDLDMRALVSRNIPIMLEGTDVIRRDIIVLEEDYLDLEKMLGRRIDGILGGDFFKGLVVSINYKKGRLTIYDPDRFEPSEKFSKHKIKILNYKPYIQSPTQIDETSDTLTYLIDSGASLALLIHSNKMKNFTLPDNVIIGNLGRGIGGDLTGFIGLTDRLDVGDYEFRNLVTSFQEIDSTILTSKSVIREGIIGNVVLSRFHVIIDYVKEIVYLRPISKLSEEFVYDKSGMLIYAAGENLDKYYIKAIYPNTPAEEAGIKAGDEIVKMGFWSTKFYDLPRIISKMQQKDGKRIKMKLRRDGEVYKTEFRLRNLFADKSDRTDG